MRRVHWQAVLCLLTGLWWGGGRLSADEWRFAFPVHPLLRPAPAVTLFDWAFHPEYAFAQRTGSSDDLLIDYLSSASISIRFSTLQKAGVAFTLVLGDTESREWAFRKFGASFDVEAGVNIVKGGLGFGMLGRAVWIPLMAFNVRGVVLQCIQDRFGMKAGQNYGGIEADVRLLGAGMCFGYLSRLSRDQNSRVGVINAGFMIWF